MLLNHSYGKYNDAVSSLTSSRDSPRMTNDKPK